MADINFLLSVSGYSGFDIDSILTAILSGESVSDICSAFQNISTEPLGDYEDSGFFYDYLHGLFRRYPEFLTSVNALRVENGRSSVEM